MKAVEIVRRAAGPAVTTDEESRIQDWNRAARELFDYKRSQKVKGKPLHDVLEVRDIHGNRLDKNHIPFYEMITRGDPVNSFEITARKASGESVRLSVSVVVVLGPDPSKYDLVYLLRPILRRRKADEAIERILANPTYGRHVLDRAHKGGSPEVPSLTRRQTDVLRLLAQGRSNEEIAKALFLSPYTVRSHVQTILDKLRVHNKLQAVSRAFRDQLL